MGGKVNVVGVGSVYGGKTSTQGGIQETVGRVEVVVQMLGAIETGVPPPPELVELVLTQGSGQYPLSHANEQRPQSL